MMTHVIGVDPGLVHTGLVSLSFRSSARRLDIEHSVIDGPDAVAVYKWTQAWVNPRPKVFIEQYKPRSHLNSDARMQQAEHELRVSVPWARFLPNMGIKRVVTKDLMDLLEVWKFPTSTHHHDLRAAARIALLGMVKETDTNKLLADVVGDHLDGRPWVITHV